MTLETLLNNKADAIVTYEISAEMQSKEKGVKLNKLYPADFAINFYGDTLYTTQALAREKPQFVEKFLATSKKGWMYALNNKEEIAKRISTELPRYLFEYNDMYEYNLAFADYINDLIQHPKKDLGEINPDRWFTMNERIRSLGLVHSHLDINTFFFEPPAIANKWTIKLLLFIALLLLTPLFLYCGISENST